MPVITDSRQTDREALRNSENISPTLKRPSTTLPPKPQLSKKSQDQGLPNGRRPCGDVRRTQPSHDQTQVLNDFSNLPSLSASHSLMLADPLLSPATQIAQFMPMMPLPTPLTFPDAMSSVPVFNFDKQIAMMLCGEYITYDLEALSDDPSVIIELLKLTGSERGTWMVVGAFYRRKGNPSAARIVIRTLLQVMAHFKISEEHMKPAFMLLSGCEVDLGRTAKSDGANVSKISEHYRQAQKYLVKVFGENDINSKFDLQVSAVSRQQGRIAHSTPDRPSARSPAFDSRGVTSQCRILEREVQSLRDRQAHQAGVLSDVRVQKRKLEDDFCDERAQRRKLEQNLRDIERQLETARRMENQALDQVKREIESRRRAEDRAEKEKIRRREIEKEAAQRDPKPLLESLAGLLHRAGAGEPIHALTSSVAPRAPRSVGELSSTSRSPGY